MQRLPQLGTFGIKRAAALDIKTISVFYTEKNKIQVFRKLSLYVVRTDDKCGFKNSAPCSNCARVISDLNIKKIVYSTEDGFISMKAENYKTDHISHGNRHVQRLKVDPVYEVNCPAIKNKTRWLNRNNQCVECC